MRLLTLLIVVLVTGCGPKIHALRAEPNVVCSGSAVTITWSASTQATLTSRPGERLVMPVAKSGSVRDSPSAMTTYRLDVRNAFGRDARQVDVDVRTPSEPKVVGASVADPATRCEGDTLSVEVELPAALWGGLRVQDVRLPDDLHRTVRVERDGRVATLGPDEPRATTFAGLPAAGTWLLRTPLSSTEHCGSATVPRSLSISLAVACP